jgi:hypothetical protein
VGVCRPVPNHPLLYRRLMRAARVDGPQTAIVKALRSYGCSVTHLHGVGDGCPDLLIGIHGRTGLVEIKDGTKPPSARKKTPAQIKWWDEWRGGPVALVTDVDGALRFARLLAFEPEGL